VVSAQDPLCLDGIQGLPGGRLCYTGGQLPLSVVSLSISGHHYDSYLNFLSKPYGDSFWLRSRIADFLSCCRGLLASLDVESELRLMHEC
jgi:hypothetical protein